METCTDPDATASSHATPHPLRQLHSKPAKHAWLRELGIVLGFYYIYQTIRSLANVAGVISVGIAGKQTITSTEWPTSARHRFSS